MTAELAIALPTLVVVTSLCLWVVVLATLRLQGIEAARAGARAAARGDPEPAVQARVARLAGVPPGAVTVARDGDDIVVSVTLRRAAPGFLGAVTPAWHVITDARAAAETSEGFP